MRKQRTPFHVIWILGCIGIFISGWYILGGLQASNMDYFLPLRLQKVITILLVGYCIGTSATLFQGITNNKILTPSVMGLDALYLCIQTVIVYFFGGQQLTKMEGSNNFLLSVGAMIIATSILFFILFTKESKSVYFLVLTGMIMGSFFGGVSSFMQVLLDPNEFSILQGKMFASFNNIHSELLGISLVLVGFISLWNRKSLPILDVLSLGRETAINLGVDYYRYIAKEWIMIALLVAVSTALVGPITFLGIMLVSLARKLTPSYQHRYVVIVASILGFILLMIAIFLAERVFGFSTTISVIINFIGGIYFIYLMIKENMA